MRQEKFTSSVALRKGVLANLVARRVECLPSAEDRELVWFVQEQSLRRVAAPHPTCALFSSASIAAPVAGATAFEQLAHDLCARFPERVSGKRPLGIVRELPALLARLCLDPKSDPANITARSFRDVIPSLRALKAEHERKHLAAVAPTSVTCAVWEALDYGLAQRGVILLEGTYRSGKSYSAQSWCLARPGRVRYVSLTAYSDETTFFRTVAAALGTAASAQRKAVEMRLRVEDALRTRDLMLVIDESENLLPATVRPTVTPERLKWIMSLDNLGVPVALIAGRNFTRLISSFERRMPAFGFEQFFGRIRLRKQLPDALTETDLFAIVERIAPEADYPTRVLLVGHTLSAKGRVAALENAVKRARYFADLAGRQMSFEDVEAAAAESAPPTARGTAPTLATRPRVTSRRPSTREATAALSPTGRETQPFNPKPCVGRTLDRPAIF